MELQDEHNEGPFDFTNFVTQQQQPNQNSSYRTNNSQQFRDQDSLKGDLFDPNNNDLSNQGNQKGPISFVDKNQNPIKNDFQSDFVKVDHLSELENVETVGRKSTYM